ncbi:winged helix-turn-helix transcriptional regulator [Actinokineospora sp.]|uniref:winged helix-turn-helix transcriptional regulator n=1 Tax=Actinokineospora sp. TaxID=1872133 RepID=UPI003D6B445D
MAPNPPSSSGTDNARYPPLPHGVVRLGDKRGVPVMRRGVLSRRLRQLENAGVVAHSGSAYALTQAGEDLRPLVFVLADWGARHAFGDPKPEELDPEVLMWWLHGRVDTSELTKRAVIQIEVADRSRVFWLVLEPGDASVCHTDPGFDVDVVLASDLATLYRVWAGEIDLTAAAKTGALSLTGTRWIVRGLPSWLQLSPAAPDVQAARLAKAADR